MLLSIVLYVPVLGSFLCSTSAYKGSPTGVSERGLRGKISTANEDILAGKVSRFRARVQYDGTELCGFQLQPDSRSVQGELEAALDRRFQLPTVVVGAGRTDAGVHSNGQVVHFDLPTASPYYPGKDTASLSHLAYCLNQMMQPDVRICDIAPVPDSRPEQMEKGLPWNANVNAVGKLYTYRLAVGEVMNPLHARNRVHFNPARHPLDLDRMEEHLSLFIGTHDFRVFSSQVDKSAAKAISTGFAPLSTIRTVRSLTMRRNANGLYANLDFVLDGALYKMVRHIVGALVSIGCNRLDPALATAALKDGVWARGECDRRCAFASAPKGLTLERVLYDPQELLPPYDIQP